MAISQPVVGVHNNVSTDNLRSQVLHLMRVGGSEDITVNSKTTTSLNLAVPIKGHRGSSGEVDVLVVHSELVGEQGLVDVTLQITETMRDDLGRSVGGDATDHERSQKTEIEEEAAPLRLLLSLLRIGVVKSFKNISHD